MRLFKLNPSLRKTKLYECVIYVRDDMVPKHGSERYYAFVGENSYMPVSALVEPEVGEAMLRIPKPLQTPMEFITDITNHKDEVHSVYLRLENSDKVDSDGERLYKITLYDFRDVEERFGVVENNLAKYRRYLSWTGYYFFEYEVDTERFIVYKYIDEKAVRPVDDQLDNFFEGKLATKGMNEKTAEQIRRFVQNLKEHKASFEMEFSSVTNPDITATKARGGVMYKNPNLMIGIFESVENSVEETYYLSSAAKDPATGLLNKRASAEYAVDHLNRKDNKIKWIIMMDIDDFKNINDTFGHLFGDLVIQRTAHIMKQVVGRRGIIGRFGGDEFFMLLEDVPTREGLKTLLKTMVKNFYYEFSPQLNMTVSIGVSQFPQNAKDYETLVGMADKALYIAKEKGKNRHIIYDAALHGEYETGNQRVKSLSYAISKEKRVEAMSELYANLAIKGAKYLKEPGVLPKVCEMMDVDAISVYTKQGDELYCATDGYAVPMPEKLPILQDPHYVELFDERGVMSMGKTVKMGTLIPEAYEDIKQRDIASTLQCFDKKDGVPYAWISFDILENSKKWSDTDIERLTVLGKLCCRLLCEEK